MAIPRAADPPRFPVRWLVIAAVAQAGMTTALLAVASGGVAPGVRGTGIVAVAVGLCWGSNTFSHIHLHAPLFRTPVGNRLFALFLTVTLGVPQTWWKHRHLRHHRLPEAAPSWRQDIQVVSEIGAMAVCWGVLGAALPAMFLGAYLPAWGLGMGLCALQGYYEHAGASSTGGIDYHGRLYNWLWFNDGYHAAHHQDPTAAWSAATGTTPVTDVTISRWPPLLRWVETVIGGTSRVLAIVLDLLERASLGSKVIRGFTVSTHRRAMAAVLAHADGRPIRRACIIGGGLFPRTALILRELRSDIILVVVDAKRKHLDRAREILAAVRTANGANGANGARANGVSEGGVTETLMEPRAAHDGRLRVGRTVFVEGRYDPHVGDSRVAREIARCDLVIVPLAYRGDRAWLYANPPAPLVLIHDWCWRRWGAFGIGVSPWLLKRMNLVARALCVQAPSRSTESVTLEMETPWSPPSSASIPPFSPVSGEVIGKRS